MKRLTALLLCALLLLSGCAAAEDGAHRDLFAMDTLIRLDAYGAGAEEALTLAETELFRLERLLSRTDADSDIGRLNAAGGQPVAVSAETTRLVEQALALRARTDGLFDITIAPAMDLWGFVSGDYRVPDEAELRDALTHVGTAVTVGDGTLALADPQAALDLGGIAKGYAGDLLLDVLRDAGLTSALVLLGGNVALLGSRPDGSDWRVAVRDPADATAYAGVISASDCHVVTSGGYERNFEAGGITYHHILDPRSGRPAESGLRSVTVVADSGLLADALSTALFVMGEQAAIDFWRESGDFDMLLITGDGRIVATGGINFEATNGAYSYETIPNQ